MHQSKVYTYKIDKQKILNTKKIINTQDDSDWEEIDNQ